MYKIYPLSSLASIKIFLLFIIIGHLSLVGFGINLSNFLDYYLIFLLMINFKLNKKNVYPFFILFIIILFNIFRFIFSDNSLDTTYFFISLKLLVFALLFISYKPSDINNDTNFFIFLKIIFLTSSYLIISDKLMAILTKGFVNGLLFRPRLIGEINFDIVLLLVIWLILKHFSKIYSKYLGYLLFFVVLISLSRSGITGYALTYFFSLQTNKESFSLSKLFKNIIIIFIGISIVLFIYYLRDPNLDFANIDRVQLFTALYNSYTSNNSITLLTGHGILAQLPYDICKAFSLYAVQTTGDANNCNPVILFSYYLRATYEYGLLITLSIPYLYYLKLRLNLSKINSLTVLMPVLAISLAVGGFYNSISIFSLLLVIKIKNL